MTFIGHDQSPIEISQADPLNCSPHHRAVTLIRNYSDIALQSHARISRAVTTHYNQSQGSHFGISLIGHHVTITCRTFPNRFIVSQPTSRGIHLACHSSDTMSKAGTYHHSSRYWAVTSIVSFVVHCITVTYRKFPRRHIT